MTGPEPLLLAVEGALAGEFFVVTAEGLTLGRDPSSTIRIEGPNVSRQHARVLLHNGAIWVQDAGSRNGVFVNGQRVADHKQVKAGDRIAVGEHLFQVTLPAPAVAAPPPRPTEPPASAPGRSGWPLGLLGLVGFVGAALVLLLLFVLAG